MRISLVILFCLLIVVVNSATSKTTPRRVVATTKRGTTKAPVRKSAYTYLRTVRGKSSCAGGSCPFWERHGRSFVSLRCYAEQYKECTCLHRMCYSSCLFSRQVCNDEMVSCLRQICPRCLPASALAMCKVYDSLAVQVTQSLSTFACYACCPNLGSPFKNSTTTPRVITITRPPGNGVMPAGATPATGSARPSQNSGNNRPVNGNAGSTNGGNNRPVIGTAASTNGGNRPVNGGTGSTNGGVNRPGTGSQGNNNNGASRNQRVQKTVQTTRRVVTTRRPATV